jgi:hypothetical protein
VSHNIFARKREHEPVAKARVHRCRIQDVPVRGPTTIALVLAAYYASACCCCSGDWVPPERDDTAATAAARDYLDQNGSSLRTSADAGTRDGGTSGEGCVSGLGHLAVDAPSPSLHAGTRAATPRRRSPSTLGRASRRSSWSSS